MKDRIVDLVKSQKDSNNYESLTEDNIEEVCNISGDSRNLQAFGGGDEGRKKQQILNNSKILVVGAGPIAQMTLVNLAGLKVGTNEEKGGVICIIDNSNINKIVENEFLYNSNVRRKKELKNRRVNYLEVALKKINSELNVKPIYSRVISVFAKRINPNVIIDATNNPYSKADCLDFAINNQVAFISASSNRYKSILTSYSPSRDRKINLLRNKNLDSLLNEEFSEDKQGNVTSGVISGLIASEVLHNIFYYNKLDSKKPNIIGQSICYNRKSKSRTNMNDDLKLRNIEDYEGNKVLVVGCGAIGNAVALFCALNGIGTIDFMDHDITKEHNLERQVLLYGGVDEPKAEILKKRVKEITKCKSTAYVKRFAEEDEKFLANGGYDVVFSCVDRVQPRYLLSELCVRYGIPLINGGSGVSGGSLTVYVPNQTYCVSCKEKLKHKAFKEREIEKRETLRTSCSDQPNPSIIMPNFVIGAAMVGESLNILDSKFDNIIKGKFVFNNSKLRKRLYIERIYITGNENKNHQCYNPLNNSKTVDT